jgi:hypothetical protein
MIPAMNRRSFPLWLLRDLPALFGIVLSFWPLMILVISSGRRAARGWKIAPAVYQHIMALLPVAEARLRYALFRQAFRAFGWNWRAVPLELIPPPETWAEAGPRFEAYRLAMSDLRQAAEIFTDLQRKHYGMRGHADANTVRAAHASMHAAHRAAAQHERVDVQRPPTWRAEAQRRRQDERVLANARGPPAFPEFRQSANNHLSALTRLRPHPRAYAVTPPRPPFSIIR